MLYEYKGIRPRIGKNAFIAPGAMVIGDVEIGEGSNLWFYTVARGDVHFIKIGSMANIQDHCMLHVTGGRHPLVIGDRVIIGHRAVLHGCTVMDGALIGIGALVLDAAVVEEGATVAAGAVVAPGTVIPAGRVAVGVPARPVRDVTEEEKAYQELNYRHYYEYARAFDEFVKPIPD